MNIPVLSLTKSAFAGYGDVVELDGAPSLPINQGFATRFDDIAKLDVESDGGASVVSIFVADPRPAPIHVRVMERHPLGSQLFYPLQDRPWLVLVCADPLDAASYRAFRAGGRQGVNYARNVWHHPLLVLDTASRFLIVDRAGPGVNLEEVNLEDDKALRLTP